MLFVAGVSRSVSENELRDLFAKHGSVLGVRLVRNPDGVHRGFAFVEMATQAECDEAKKNLSGLDVKGRTLVLEDAKRNSPRMS